MTAGIDSKINEAQGSKPHISDSHNSAAEPIRATHAYLTEPGNNAAARPVRLAPLTPSQERWIASERDPAPAGQCITAQVWLEGSLDIDTLQKAWNQLVSQHEILRTRFVRVHGEYVQAVDPPAEVDLHIEELSQVNSFDRDAVIDQLRIRQKSWSIDLSAHHPLRAQVFRISDQCHLLHIVLNPAAFDAHSVDLLLCELGDHYRAWSGGGPALLPKTVRQYSEFAESHRTWLQEADAAEQLGWWKDHLKNASPLLEIPGFPDQSVEQPAFARESVLLPHTLTKGLDALAKEAGGDVRTVLLAACLAVLQRYCGRENLALSLAVSGRTSPATRNLIGTLANYIVLRADLHGDPSFAEVLEKIGEEIQQALARQEIPYEWVMGKLLPARDAGHSSLCQVSVEFLDETGAPNFGDVAATCQIIEPADPRFDFSLRAARSGDAINTEIVYRTELLDGQTTCRFLNHLQCFLEHAAQDPDRSISEIPMLTEPERRQLLIDWNQTQADYPRDRCFHELFEEQVKRTPDAVAVECQGRRLSYRELDARSNQLARHLQRHGVGPEVLVALCISRSLEMMVGLLGILKAGGAYVPIDPTYPKERRDLMVGDARARVLLTERQLVSSLPQTPATIISLDGDSPFDAESSAKVTCMAAPDNLAYVIYTSGSTGKPKGAMITHRGLVNYLYWCIREYRVAEGSGAPVHSSISFDLTITGLFSPLLVGKCVNLLREDPGIEPLVEALETQDNYSLVKITPAHLELLSRQLSPEGADGRTRAFIIGGENLLGESIAFWQEAAPETILVNEYGPTETVVGCCIYKVPLSRRHPGPIPIGRPIANTRLYVLNKSMQPVPIGVPGELYIGGDGVARGYLHEPQLTAERFLPDPFAAMPGERLYKTGDLVRYLPSGDLEFLGRIDYQIKLRGHRIELGEIESLLNSVPAVGQSVVLMLGDEGADKKLVAYLVPAPGQHVDEGLLRQSLKERLPAYMVPSAFVTLDAFPLTSNGKLDRKALPAPEAIKRIPAETVSTPLTPTQQSLADVWCVVLGWDYVGIDENFFDIGGHSLLAVRLIDRINNAFDINLRVLELFQNPTIRQLESIIAGHNQAPSSHPVIVQFQKGGSKVPVFFIYAGPDEFRIGRLLDNDRPIYGIEVPWPAAWRADAERGLSAALPTLADLVSPYVRALVEHARSGPCILAGYSFAGIMAFEAAHQFQACGGRIERIMLLDSWAFYPRPPIWTRMGRLVRKHTTRMWDYVKSQSNRMNGRDFKYAPHSMPTISGITTRFDHNGIAFPWTSIEFLYNAVRPSFRPRPLNARGYLFHAENPRNACFRALGPTYGWGGLFTQGLEVIPVAGDHLAMIRQETHALALAKKINAVLR